MIRAAADLAVPSVEALHLVTEYPLTRRQTLFWLDEQLYPQTPYHHIVLRLTLSGPLDVERFRSAYRETILAFDQFRLVFATRNGEPFQSFRSELSPELPVVEITEELLEAWIQSRSVPRFNFEEALFDGALLRLSPERHVFFFCQHHIISDGTSLGLFVLDLGRRYAAEPVAARPSYALYLRHEQAYQASPRAQRDAAHFAKKLAGAMPPLALYGKVRKLRSARTHRSHLDLGEQRSAALSELVRDPRVELIDAGMSRLVALATVVLAFLYRSSAERGLVLALPMPNRSAEFLATGGLIMEQTFLRVQIDEGETFSSLATKIRQELFSSLRHGRHCISDRGLSYVTLNLLRLPTLQLPGLEAQLELAPVATLSPSMQACEGDLRDTLGIHVIGFDEGQPLRVGFDFHEATFDEPQRGRAKGHFLALFDALLADLETPLDKVELLSAEERDELLLLGRGAQPELPAQDPLLHFAELLSQRSGSIALRFQGRAASYGELFMQVGQLAARLRQLGVSTGKRVAFCTPRSPDELLCMLATWSAGGAYVPLDIGHPRDRIRMILDDAAPTVLVTHRTLLARLDLPPQLRLLLLDDEREQLAGLAPLPLSGPEHPEQAAYVLFTSGSTGRPKGVEIPRRAIANFLRSMAHTPGLTSADRLLAITTTTFDIAGLELLLPLWVGAAVHVADRETVLDAHIMRETLEREAITCMQATPTTWRLLLEAGYGREPRALKMLCGGEAVSRELAQRLLATGGELWNMYGPTETTVWSTLARLAPDQETVSIGRPIDATEVYVLSPAGALQARGVTGELCIGGAGVALGYLHQPELTSQRFIQNPYAQRPDLIYRTGDLARFEESGELSCLGRLDHQVKVRGFRIELGEIESALRAAAGLREVVVAPVGPSEDPRLVAYWVGEKRAERAMRACAMRALPSYMQPAAYHQLPALPLNTNGKVDRKLLPMPDWSHAHNDSTHQFDSDNELRMASLFHEVLGGIDVPIDKDFFLLGGDSVRAIQLRRRIQEEFGTELPLNAMFDSPTVRGLVASLQIDQQSVEPLFVRLRSGRRDLPPLICIMGVALYRDLALALNTERAVYGVHVPLALTPGQPWPSVEDIARLYTELILARVPEGPYHLTGLCFGGLVAFEVAHQLLSGGHEVATLAILDGLLPRGSVYSPHLHAQALLRDPQRVLKRAGQRLRGLSERLSKKTEPVAVARPVLLDLELQGAEAAEMARAYDRNAQPLPISFTLFRATEREDAAWYRIDAMLGWGSLGAPVTVHSVPGNHLSILKRGHVAAVAEVLSAELGSRMEQRPSLLALLAPGAANSRL